MGRETEAGRGRAGNRGTALLLKGLYWLAVLVVSLALLIGLILLLESRDSSSVNGLVSWPLLG
jgi:hypothetical protein